MVPSVLISRSSNHPTTCSHTVERNSQSTSKSIIASTLKYRWTKMMDWTWISSQRTAMQQKKEASSLKKDITSFKIGEQMWLILYILYFCSVYLLVFVIKPPSAITFLHFPSDYILNFSKWLKYVQYFRSFNVSKCFQEILQFRSFQ